VRITRRITGILTTISALSNTVQKRRATLSTLCVKIQLRRGSSGVERIIGNDEVPKKSP